MIQYVLNMSPANIKIGVTKKEQRALIKQVKLGTKAEAKIARRKLIYYGQFWVGIVAAKYINNEVSFSQLMSAGNRGLRKAVKMYNHKKNYQFATYATWWIRNAIIKELIAKENGTQKPDTKTD